MTPAFLFWNSLSVFLICYDAKQKIYTEEDVIWNFFSIKNENKNHFKEIDKNSILRKYNKINEYDEYDNEEDKYIGYNRFLLKQLKSNQHAEKNSSLSWHQTQHSLPCSYQTLNYWANNSWKLQTRHFASSPLSPEEIISKKVQ